jgi:hypothetical protein
MFKPSFGINPLHRNRLQIVMQTVRNFFLEKMFLSIYQFWDVNESDVFSFGLLLLMCQILFEKKNWLGLELLGQSCLFAFISDSRPCSIICAIHMYHFQTSSMFYHLSLSFSLSLSLSLLTLILSPILSLFNKFSILWIFYSFAFSFVNPLPLFWHILSSLIDFFFPFSFLHSQM